jgi:hypothetical protein
MHHSNHLHCREFQFSIPEVSADPSGLVCRGQCGVELFGIAKSASIDEASRGVAL